MTHLSRIAFYTTLNFTFSSSYNKKERNKTRYQFIFEIYIYKLPGEITQTGKMSIKDIINNIKRKKKTNRIIFFKR